MSNRLINQARLAGRVVVERAGRTTLRIGRWDGVCISEVGTITRLGVDLVITKAMTVKEARHVLKLDDVSKAAG